MIEVSELESRMMELEGDLVLAPHPPPNSCGSASASAGHAPHHLPPALRGLPVLDSSSGDQATKVVRCESLDLAWHRILLPLSV